MASPAEYQSVELPPKYAVRDYLKRQIVKMETLGSDSMGTFLETWREAYRRGAISTETLKRLAEEYLDLIKSAGGFALDSYYVQPTKAFRNRERVTLSGYVLEPIGLGQSWLGKDATPYVENAALLRVAVAQIRRKKASVGTGMGCVVLTQHLLERVYERTEVERSRLGLLIENEFNDLMGALALADIASLWIERVEGDGACRVTAVPYSNGLMLVNERVLLGDFDEGDFGFRLEIPSGRLHTPFINPSVVTEDLGAGRFLQGNMRLVTIKCGVTYMNVLTLDRDESDYYYCFKALMEKIGGDTLNVLAHHAFAPLLPHQEAQKFVPEPEIEGKIVELSSLLNSGWLKTYLSDPLCYLLPFDHQVMKSATKLP